MKRANETHRRTVLITEKHNEHNVATALALTGRSVHSGLRSNSHDLSREG
jgi:hypothetical protein